MNTLLLVEDEKIIRQGIRIMIERSGVEIKEIIECNNGLSALEILKTRPIDVMFTDIRMPKMDGIQLVDEIQKLDHKPLIAAISGFDEFDYAVNLMRNGVTEYISKPVDREIIKKTLEKFNASYLIHLDCSPLLISERLGHEKVQTTLNTYSHLYPNKQQELVDMMEAAHDNGHKIYTKTA